jgi:hypothetical protein
MHFPCVDGDAHAAQGMHAIITLVDLMCADEFGQFTAPGEDPGLGVPAARVPLPQTHLLNFKRIPLQRSGDFERSQNFEITKL